MMSNREYVQAVVSELEEKGVYTFFEEDENDIYDIEYAVDATLSFIGAKAAISLGGPTIYIDSRLGEVVLYWGSDEEHYSLSSDCKADVDNYFEEMYQMMRGC